MDPHEKPHEEARSPHWPAARRAHLAQHPACEVCGHDGERVNVHHIKPFHLYPELELVDSNLITLCEDERYVNCHLFVGHLGNFHGWNPLVRTDAELWKRKLAENKARIEKAEAK